MHARHRSPGNGYRTGSMGMGSRISPEISGRDHGFYNAEYRNPIRGYGRGQNQMKPFQSSPPRPSKSGDIFMEAGKLAAEYLVSKGLLPPRALSGKWQNGSFKKKVGGYHDFRFQEGDGPHFSSEGRPSALSRLGHSVSDAAQSRRRYTDDYSSSGSRNLSKERRKGGSFRSHSSDWSREYVRSGSSSERTRGAHDKEVDSDSATGNHEEQQVVKDVNNDSQKSDSDDFAPKGEVTRILQSDLEKQNMQDETGSDATLPGAAKHVDHETSEEPSKRTVESASLVPETGDLKDCSHDNESSKPGRKEDSPKQNFSTENASSSKDVTDLLSLCNFAKIPTKTRSSLVHKSLKIQSIPRNDEHNFSHTGASVKFEVAVEDDSVAGSSDEVELNKTHKSDCQNTVIAEDLPVPSVEDAEELDHLFVGQPGNFGRSQSLPGKVLLCVSEPELVQGIPYLQRSSSMVTEIGEKRRLEQCDDWNETKKQRGWLDTMQIKDDLYVPLSEFADKKWSSEGDRPSSSPSEKLNEPVTHNCTVASSQLLGSDGELTDKYSQEKQQLIPSSFKICDLNLMEASDVNENNQNHPIAGCSTSEPNREVGPVDIDLTMRNSSNSGGDSFRTSNCSKIEIIDLENDSGPEDQEMDDTERKNEEVFVDMNGDTTNAPDQYDGLMINEYLGNFSSSPQVPPDIDPHSMQNDGMNPVPNTISVHNEEGALGDDDSIYMSLEEIPLSFIQVWGQPPAQ